MERLRETLESKLREYLVFLFLVIKINKNGIAYDMNQTQYLKELEILMTYDKFEQFRTMSHKLAWITHSRPE